jgi:PPK2 family polyphosphate:nucleotide phosphotransferase
MKADRKLVVKPGTKVKLLQWDPGDTGGMKSKADADKKTCKHCDVLDRLQNLLYAQRKHALLVVLQALDAGGKDGTIRHVMSGVNPQGCVVTSFKAPTQEELSHDYLWRIHKAVPERGMIGIFNRSHYEDVLVVRVHGLVPKEVWSKRYDEINEFEKGLSDNGVTILKFFLHISKGEQKKRFEERLDDPTKNWKVSQADFDERKYWADYTRAYEDALSRTSTKWAPWRIVPADHKWYRDLVVSKVIAETLEGLNMKYPKPAMDLKKVVIQ